ncbi:MAG: MmcQ/YjbR family DNA-binding protein, partial [Acetobacteraceae bacterium]
VVPWDGAEVWKPGGKVCAIGRFVGADAFFTVKAGEIGYEFPNDQPGVRPAPSLASRGLKWVQLYDRAAMPETELRSHPRQSHARVTAGLPRRAHRSLGLEEPENPATRTAT